MTKERRLALGGPRADSANAEPGGRDEWEGASTPPPPAAEHPTTRYYHCNWQGSTMALSDQTGQVTARLSYSPYGEVTVVSGTPNTPFLFNGQFGVMTEPNGLYSMQARFPEHVLLF